MERRTFVTSTGFGLTAAFAGCLDDIEPAGTAGAGDDDPNGNGSTGGPSNHEAATYELELVDEPLVDDESSAELTVELVDPSIAPDSPAEIEATVTNTADEAIRVSSGAPWPFGVVWAESADDAAPITLWSDAYAESDYVDTDGKHVEGVDAVGLVEALDARESITRAFEIHAETPHFEVGTYNASIACGVEPEGSDESGGLEVDLVVIVESGGSEQGGDGVIPEEPRVDEPPYEITEPEPPDSWDDDWNDHYLGEEMPMEPSLEFDVLSGGGLAESALSIDDETDGQYVVHLLESEDERDERFDFERIDDTDRERMLNVDFDDQLLVVVESGFGSGSVDHRWNRVEDVEDGIHLHGYYTEPFERTADYTTRVSTLLVERPADDVGLARVSLTVDAETRVHVNSTEGAVTREE